MQVTRHIFAGVIACASLIFGVATAAPITWDLTGAAGLQATGVSLKFGELEAKAFHLDTNNGVQNTPVTDLLNGINSALPATVEQLGQYSAGLGVTSVGTGDDPGTPEHTMDNQLSFEFIVFKLPGVFAFSSLQLNSVAGGALRPTGTGDADVTVWIGGSDVPDFDFFAGKTLGSILGSPNTASLSGTRFQQLNLTTSSACATGGEGTNGAGTIAGCSSVVYTLGTPTVVQPAPVGSDAEGPWLIVAAAFTINGNNVVDRDDDLLIAQLTASAVPDSTGIPGPATFSLLGLGLAGLGWSRRRNLSVFQ